MVHMLPKIAEHTLPLPVDWVPSGQGSERVLWVWTCCVIFAGTFCEEWIAKLV